MIKNYFLTSSTFRYFLPDWIFGIALLGYFFLIAETAKPFPRKFSIENPNLQYPFATTERVTDNQLYLLAVVLPAVVIIGVTLYQKRRQSLAQYDFLNLLTISILGLFLSFTITGTITDVLKVWIARPRPDFLARCGPRKGTDPQKLVGFEVCTSPIGEMYLYDGMKSTPSGHASISFAGLLYLSLWLVGQFRITSSPRALISSYFIPSLPIVLAIYIALSRTQDYRHHFFDIVFGGAIGITIAWWNYFKLFPQLDGQNSDQAKTQEKSTLLPS